MIRSTINGCIQVHWLMASNMWCRRVRFYFFFYFSSINNNIRDKVVQDSGEKRRNFIALSNYPCKTGRRNRYGTATLFRNFIHRSPSFFIFLISSYHHRSSR
jgi:competence CoiA-like predicted nuclease